MKKVIICVLLMMGIASVSYAAAPIQPAANVKGCWAADYILSFMGGNSQLPPNNQPFYTYPARKMVGHSYLRVDNQSGAVITGKWFTFLGPVSCSPQPCTLGQFYEYPIEGYISGNLISLTSNVESGYAGNEEHRFLSGIITSDANGRVIRGSGLTSRNYSASAGVYAWSNLTFQFWMRPFTATSCTASALPWPQAPEFSPNTCGFSCPY